MPRDPDNNEKRPLVSNPPSRQSLDESSKQTSLTPSAHHQNQTHDGLRAWFHSESFNRHDGLDDYDQDFNTFHPLENIMTADMRHHIERRIQVDRQKSDRQKANPSKTESRVTSEPSADSTDMESGTSISPEEENVIIRNETSTLKLISSGRLMIIGSEDQVIACGRKLADRLNCVLLVESDASFSCRLIPVSDGPNLPLIHGQIAEISGFLGKFAVSIMMKNEKRLLTSLPGLDRTNVDLILDLASPPHIQCERLPLGYFAPENDSEALNQVIDALPDMVGEFEKPRFISEVSDLCAHHRSRFRGCRRCIDTCPADAIRSQGDAIEVNHHLCQGCGLCAAVCPTGALINDDSQADELLHKIRHELHVTQPTDLFGSAVVFHEPEACPECLAQVCSEWAGPIMQLSVEEIGAIGSDIWFAALAYGAEQVILVPSPQTTPGMRRAIETQIGYAALILKGMGYSSKRVILADGRSPEKNAPSGLAKGKNKISNLPGIAATFSHLRDRRQLMRSAIEHLYDQSPRQRPAISLPSGAPFGTIRIDKSACTFCMACAQVCPTSALSGGSDQPQIKMVEAHCIQCGLCRRACPEKAIALHPRMVYERNISEAQEILNHAAAFNCICCGKPFAPARLVERMVDRLNNHWMYRSRQERQRLKMCSDCRLQDIVTQHHSEKS